MTRVVLSHRIVTAAVLAAALGPGVCSGAPPAAWPDALADERFLASAEVVDQAQIPIGVTRPQRLTLSDGNRTADAVWKTIDERVPFKRFDDGTFEMSFSDSYKYEIAAYELDKLLGLGLVPPTVERKLRRERGSLQIWIEDAVMELDRRKSGAKVKDPEFWNRQMYSVRLFHNLTYNTDFNNAGNILSDADSRIYLIDHSRAFRTTEELLAEEDLTRFSQSALEALRALDRRGLVDHLGRWLSKAQIDALLARRDLIVRHAERLIDDVGADAVLYP